MIVRSGPPVRHLIALTIEATQIMCQNIISLLKIWKLDRPIEPDQMWTRYTANLAEEMVVSL
jgi:hypothetical protein